MFLENDYARPLFDLKDGGPPRAFLCLIQVEWQNAKLHEILGRSSMHRCGKITRTESGMRAHLKKVHNWEEQECLYSTTNHSQTKQENAPQRNLRVSQKPLASIQMKVSSTQDTEQEQDPKSEALNTNEPKTNDGG